MAGPAEEVGKAAGTFMEIMKGQPLALALCVMNILLMGLFFYVSKSTSEAQEHRFASMMESQKEVQQLLYNCVPQQR